jgi:hypothetical protein
VLDVGCGDGLLTRAAAGMLPLGYSIVQRYTADRKRVHDGPHHGPITPRAHATRPHHPPAAAIAASSSLWRRSKFSVQRTNTTDSNTAGYR